MNTDTTIGVQVKEEKRVPVSVLRRLDMIASSIATRIESEGLHCRGSGVSVGYRWPSGELSFAPRGALGILAATFPKLSAITIGRAEDGETVAVWDTGHMILRGPDVMLSNFDEFDGYEGPATAIVPLARGIELADEDGKVPQLADKLIEELGLRVKPKKPSQVEAWKAREKNLAAEIGHIEERVAEAARLAEIDGTPFTRAETLYVNRCAQLRRIAGAMRHDYDLEEQIGRFLPAMPKALAREAIEAASIPAKHNVKRERAALVWYGKAQAWIDRIMGLSGRYWRRPMDGGYIAKASAPKIHEVYRDMLRGTGAYESSISFCDIPRRLETAREGIQARETLSRSTADLTKARNALLSVQLKIEAKEGWKRFVAAGTAEGGAR